MKEFNNINAALQHHTHCYVCNHRLSMQHDHNIQIDLGTENTVLTINTTAGMDTECDELIVIDVATNRAKYYEQNRNHNSEFTYVTGTEYSGRTPIKYYLPRSREMKDFKFTGLFHQSVNIECFNCNRFGYVLQVIVDTTHHGRAVALLNSEFISYEDKGYLHEINNIYATNKTRYIYHSRDGNNTQNITLPLVPINLENPGETVARLRKLIVFS